MGQDSLLFVIYGLACYRLAVLFSHDSGPWHAFLKLRSYLKKEAKTNKPLRQSKIQDGIQCLRCSSLELALPLAAFAHYHDQLWTWLSVTGDVFLLACALSALAILAHRAFPAR